MKTKTFINNYKNLYEIASTPKKEIPEIDKGIIKVHKVHTISSESEFEGYCFSVNGNEIKIENFDEVKEYLAKAEYKIDYSQSVGYGLAFVNVEKQREYNEVVEEIRRYNEAINVATKKLIQATSEMLGNYSKTYIRFGLVPESGESYNFREETFENGVSCFSAIKVEDKYVVDIVGGMFTYFGYINNCKPVYELLGEEIGKGGDGEPLLQKVKIIKKINPDNLYTIKEFICYLFGDGC